MEKITLFKKRNFGETIGTALELLRENFRLISMSYLIMVVPLLILSLVMAALGFGNLINNIKVGASARGPGSSEAYIGLTLITAYLGYILTFFAQAVVVHEVVIAYEHSEDHRLITVSDIWSRIKADMGPIAGSLFGILPIWLVIVIVCSLIYRLSALISDSMAGLSVVLMVIGYVYLQVCMSSFLMLRLRSRYSLIRAFSGCVALTVGGWRWWKTCGVHFIMILISNSFFACSLMPFSLIVYLYVSHNAESADRDTMVYTISAIGWLYAGAVFSYLNNLILLGSTANYYSLMEEKEHVGLQSDIANLGLANEPAKYQEGEY